MAIQQKLRDRLAECSTDEERAELVLNMLKLTNEHAANPISRFARLMERRSLTSTLMFGDEQPAPPVLSDADLDEVAQLVANDHAYIQLAQDQSDRLIRAHFWDDDDRHDYTETNPYIGEISSERYHLQNTETIKPPRHELR